MSQLEIRIEVEMFKATAYIPTGWRLPREEEVGDLVERHGDTLPASYWLEGRRPNYRAGFDRQYALRGGAVGWTHADWGDRYPPTPRARVLIRVPPPAPKPESAPYRVVADGKSSDHQDEGGAKAALRAAFKEGAARVEVRRVFARGDELLLGYARRDGPMVEVCY